MRGLAGAAMRRRLVGGGPSVRTRISSVESMSTSFRGDALPDATVLELGEGYRFAISVGGLGGEGDWERTERGEEGGDDCC